MYHHLSRAVFRSLLALLEPAATANTTTRQTILDACEATVRRLSSDPETFGDPARFLFGEIRALYPMHAQLPLRRAINRDLAVAAVLIERRRRNARRPCAASTRSGTACRREPVAGSKYCPSHRHLERTFDLVTG